MSDKGIITDTNIERWSVFCSYAFYAPFSHKEDFTASIEKQIEVDGDLFRYSLQLSMLTFLHKKELLTNDEYKKNKEEAYV